MKYKLWVTAVNGNSDMDGEYNGIEYNDLAEVTYAKHIANIEHPEVDIVIEAEGGDY